MAQIHRVGEPENASEAKAVRTLAEALPDSYRIFHNFEVQSGGETPLDPEVVLAELATPGSEDFMKSREDAFAVLLRMCRQDPAQRYESVDQVIEDLAILAEE